MKLSFSTRGWADLGWDDALTCALDMGFDGIEPYNIMRNPEYVGAGGPFHKYSVTRTSRNLRWKSLSIPCLDSSCDISSDSDRTLSEAEAMMVLADAAQIPYVSLYAREDNHDGIRGNLDILARMAGQYGVTLLIKTSGVFSDTSKLRALLDEYACDNIAVLWDVHHPYRDCGESPYESIKNLGGYVRHVHLRDSDDAGRYCIIGEGTFPVAEVINSLSSIDYDGFVSLEWKPDWMSEMPDRDVIFPYFINYMKRFERARSRRTDKLYPNHDGTGWYIWDKDDLIDLTFPKVLDRLVAEFPDQYCFKYTTLDYIRTYSEFRDDVDNFARALVSLGVRPGSKVSVWATNVPAWYISFWATVKIGAVLVTVNTAYKSHEVEYLLRQSDTHTLVMMAGGKDSDYRSIINGLCPEITDTVPGEPLHCSRLPFLRNVITVGFRQKGCLSFEEAMERKNLVPLETVTGMAAEVSPDDVCNMQYTSGTTGFPKGVMLTHYNVINNGKCIGDRMGLSTADRMMIQVPMFHCFGMVLSMTASVTHGATMCPLPYFSAKSSLACINSEHITCFNGVPTMFIAMFNHPDYRKTDFSHMRTGIMAGAGCPPELMRRAARPDEMNMRGIVSVYGQTETSPGCTMSAWTDSLDVRCDTVGYPFPHVQCKVVNPETGLPAAPGENGEFCSRGYNTMKGYYKMPDATAAAVDAGGWMHSGDLACVDENGNYHITGRLKDMIIRGGENIYPKEIEEFIYTHPCVQDVQVIAIPDVKYGEEAMACIILKDGCSVSEAEMRGYITASLATHKVPRYIEFVESFPMNAAGKVLKYKMREHFVEKLGLNRK
ncbi:MAG: AMP-binding protein [Bacteroidales bacterium]|nr:AMP-binding protein [Bacteroidales bacterium]